MTTSVKQIHWTSISRQTPTIRIVIIQILMMMIAIFFDDDHLDVHDDRLYSDSTISSNSISISGAIIINVSGFFFKFAYAIPHDGQSHSPTNVDTSNCANGASKKFLSVLTGTYVDVCAVGCVNGKQCLVCPIGYGIASVWSGMFGIPVYDCQPCTGVKWGWGIYFCFCFV